MRKFLLPLFFSISLIVNAQLNVKFPFFSDSINDYYWLNYGISLCNPKDGSYAEAIKFLQNINVKKDSKNLIYLQHLISYQTEGKIPTFEKINNSKLEEKEKELLKLWLFAVTKNDNDFEIKLSENQKKHPNDIDIKKIEIRKLLQDRHDLIYTNTDFEEISNTIVSILKHKKLSRNDKIFFTALKLDCEYYLSEDSKSMKTERTRIIREYSDLWRQNKSYFIPDYTKINFKLKANDSNHYFELTEEKEPNNEIFESYLFIIYGNPLQDTVGSDNKKYVNFLQNNPFYYGEWNGGYSLSDVDWNPSPKKVKNYNDFLLYLEKIENIINKYPGALGPKYAYIDALIENKDFIYTKDVEVYQTKFLKRIIDIFALDQRADFANHFTYFRDILKEENLDTNSDYHKIIFQEVKKSNKEDINNYLNDIEKKFPNNVNLKTLKNIFQNL